MVDFTNGRQFYDKSKFMQFRLNLVGFLRLPENVSENALRAVLHKCSPAVFATYLARAEQAELDGTTESLPMPTYGTMPRKGVECS